MADEKYGRIFTVADVHAIVEKAIERDFTGRDQLALFLESYKGTFPADEPVFVLRARDRYARGTILKYRDLCDITAGQPHIDGIEQALRSFESYAKNNETKVPD